MKKKLHKAVAFALVCSMLTACSGAGNNSNSDNKAGTQVKHSEVLKEDISVTGNDLLVKRAKEEATVVGAYEIADGAATVELDTDKDGATESWTVIRQLTDFPKTLKDNQRYILANDIDCGGKFLAKTTIQLGAGSILEGNGYGILNFATDHEGGETTGKSGIFTLGTGSMITVRNLHFGTPDAPVNIDNCLVNRSGDENPLEITTWENVDVYMNMTREDGGHPAAFFSCAKGEHTFIDCDVVVYSCASTNESSNIGAFVGHTATNSRPLKFVNCTASGNIQTEARTGGLIGRIELGEEISVSMTNCRNYTNVSGNYAGGFIGLHYNTSDLTMTDCVNYGNISGIDSAGGFAGKNDGESIFTNCVNRGIVNCQTYAGGFFGYSGQKTNTFENCLNAGNVTCEGGAINAGGFCGYVANATWKNSTNIGKISLNVEAASSIPLGCGNLAGYAGVWDIENCYGFGSTNGEHAAKGVMLGTAPEVGKQSGNKYIMLKNNNEKLLGAEAEGRIDVSAALTELNSRYKESAFVLGDDELPVLAEPILADVQVSEADASNNMQAVRFVGIVNSLAYTEVGFTFNISYVDSAGEQKTETVSTVFDSIENEVSAAELGGKYLFAITLKDIPTNVGEVAIEVEPFAIGTDEAATKYVGKSQKVFLADADFVSNMK